MEELPLEEVCDPENPFQNEYYFFLDNQFFTYSFQKNREPSYTYKWNKILREWREDLLMHKKQNKELIETINQIIKAKDNKTWNINTDKQFIEMLLNWYYKNITWITEEKADRLTKKEKEIIKQLLGEFTYMWNWMNSYLSFYSDSIKIEMVYENPPTEETQEEIPILY